ncbi:hypothetical protein BC374_27650 [Ensifer sp. LC13]|nr:hypothetical protein BC362_28010 [Ensifer sp. LC14]OCP02664.1 hypothetical protein BBX50_27640 [Ensifer sp. LC11]OCP02998.1 hypothetical protein BC374_27650 [Ensifer sp. LC13]OCP29929.1 hypothetical protein BC364_27755 [Ensifer sp. LC499]
MFWRSAVRLPSRLTIAKPALLDFKDATEEMIGPVWVLRFAEDTPVIGDRTLEHRSRLPL